MVFVKVECGWVFAVVSCGVMWWLVSFGVVLLCDVIVVVFGGLFDFLCLLIFCDDWCGVV